MYGMDAKTRRALTIIRRCLSEERYRLTVHFRKRLGERGLVWPDVLAVVDAPDGVRGDGLDEYDRPRWIIGGTATDGLAIEIVCVLDTDDDGNFIVFVTVYERTG